MFGENLPVKGVLPELGRALALSGLAVLEAPPGTGKTLLAAPYLLDAPFLKGKKIILLEPRRLAARMAASSMARLMGQNVGETVGYQVRHDRRIGPKTRIEVLTEGVFVKRILKNPELDGVGLVIFDEFHERSAELDFSLALLLDSRSLLRPDIALLLMSATIKTDAVLRHLGKGAALVRAQSALWPVETRHLPIALTDNRIDELAAKGVLHALRETEGGILVFLPGEREIRGCENLLRAAPLAQGCEILPLYGALPARLQDRAVFYSGTEKRKIVLSTSIAESSLTIEGIRVVVDSGFARVMRYSHATGISRLETGRASRDRTDQRRGRAGRLGPGVCYRLWDMRTDSMLPGESKPEIEECDLAPLRLDAAIWGARNRSDLPWMTMPPADGWESAGELLRSIGAIDPEGYATDDGRAIAAYPAHPRLAHMISLAKKAGFSDGAILLAALLEELNRSSLRIRETDAESIYGCFLDDGEARSLPGEFAASVRKSALRMGLEAIGKCRGVPLGRLLSWAYPDRIAISRNGGGTYRLVRGGGAKLPKDCILSGEKCIVAADLEEASPDSHIRIAAKAELSDVRRDFGHLVNVSECVKWDRRADRVVSSKVETLGEMELSVMPVSSPHGEKARKALCEGILLHGVNNLGWDERTRNFRSRVAFAARYFPEMDWPDFSDAHLAENLEEWLGGYIDGVTQWEELKKMDLLPPLEARLGGLGRELDKIAPKTMAFPSGRKARISYSENLEASVSSKLQDFFGMKALPRIACGRASLKAVLLSPAGRPVAITDDLQSFWTGGYLIARKELKGRYPKHDWPERP